MAHPANIYLFKVNNRNTRKRSEICSKLTTKTPTRRQWRRSGVFTVNFEHILHLFVVFLLLTLNTQLLVGTVKKCIKNFFPLNMDLDQYRQHISKALKLYRVLHVHSLPIPYGKPLTTARTISATWTKSRWERLFYLLSIGLKLRHF